MTPAEVEDAAADPTPRAYGRTRILATGVTVRQWYYSAHAEDWPTLIMFREGKVAGWE